MGSGLCTPKNVIMVEYDESNRVKNFTIHGCYYHAPLEFQFKRPTDTASKAASEAVCDDPTCKDFPCSSKRVAPHSAKKYNKKVAPAHTVGV